MRDLDGGTGRSSYAVDTVPPSNQLSPEVTVLTIPTGQSEKLPFKQREAGATLTIAARATLAGAILLGSNFVFGKIGMSYPQMVDWAFTELTNEESEASGEVVMSKIYPLPYSEEFFRIPVLAVGSVKDDVTLEADPNGSKLVETIANVAVKTRLPVGARIVHDPRIAEIIPEYKYIVVVSSFDADQNPLPIEISDIEYTQLFPQECRLDSEATDRTKRIQFKDCLDPDDENATGRSLSASVDGGITYGRDFGIVEDAEGMAGIMQHNNNCVLRGILGARAFRQYDPENGVFYYDPNDSTDIQIYEGAKATHLAATRQNAALAYGVPVGNVFVETEYRYLLDHIDEFQKADLSDPPLVSESETTRARHTVARIIDDPVLVDLDSSGISGLRLEHVFGNLDGASLQTDFRNYGFCMPQSQEALDTITNTFAEIDFYAENPWFMPVGQMGDGSIITREEVSMRVAKLEAFLK